MSTLFARIKKSLSPSPRQKFHSPPRFPLLFSISLEPLSVLFLRAKLAWAKLAWAKLAWAKLGMGEAGMGEAGHGRSWHGRSWHGRSWHGRSWHGRARCVVICTYPAPTQMTDGTEKPKIPSRFSKHTARYNEFGCKTWNIILQ